MANVNDPLVISSFNSTSTALGINTTFTGIFEQTTQYAEVDFTISGSGTGLTPGSVVFEFSSDGVNPDISVSLTIADLNQPLVPIPLRMILPFFRMKYVNGAVAQNTFKLITVYHNTSAVRLTRFLNQNINDSEPVEITAAILKARNVLGNYQNIQ